MWELVFMSVISTVVVLGISALIYLKVTLAIEDKKYEQKLENVKKRLEENPTVENLIEMIKDKQLTGIDYDQILNILVDEIKKLKEKLK